MIGMNFCSLRLFTALLLLLIACSTPTDTSQLPPVLTGDGVPVNRSGLWAVKVFATFPTFIDEASSSQPALALDRAAQRIVPDVQPEAMTPNPIMYECAGIAWFSDGSTKSSSFKPCAPGFNPQDLLKWFKSWPNR